MQQKKKPAAPLSYEEFKRAMVARGFKLGRDKDGKEIFIDVRLKKPRG